eukprot:CAMPEP_0172932320 /NCGR_PEP_ID=MMETSP1075-20121228/219941_1 /TAXON_ID=2916 /ORGANISM="Ceratium fusus, Strain PA161109" /LENGTH=329 /DNA_ID=CAMNT_0013793647 /DNA_START=106 /DNA_END=1099 /DNA_ORIENTATION=+
MPMIHLVIGLLALNIKHASARTCTPAEGTYVFAGTFDPPQIGHKIVLQTTAKEVRHVIVVPTNDAVNAVLKPYATPYAQRLKWTREMAQQIGKRSKVSVSDIENPVKYGNAPAPDIAQVLLEEAEPDRYPAGSLGVVLGSDYITSGSLQKWGRESGGSFPYGERCFIVHPRGTDDISDLKAALQKDGWDLTHFHFGQGGGMISSVTVRKDMLKDGWDLTHFHFIQGGGMISSTASSTAIRKDIFILSILEDKISSLKQKLTREVVPTLSSKSMALLSKAYEKFEVSEATHLRRVVNEFDGGDGKPCGVLADRTDHGIVDGSDIVNILYS